MGGQTPSPAADRPAVNLILTLQETAGNVAVARTLARDLADTDASAIVEVPPSDAGAPAGAPVVSDADAGQPPSTAAPSASDDFDFSPLVPAGFEADDIARLREMYQQGARQIAEEARAMEVAAHGDAARLRQIADWAVRARNELKARIRDDGIKIVKVIAEARNIKRYGNPLGPSAEGLRARGLSDAQIVESAARSNRGFNRWAGRLRVAGPIMIAIDLGIASWRIYHAETNRPQVIGQEAGGIAGALVGGWARAKAGAWIGGAIGTFIEPGGGTAVGGAVGGFIGGIAGAIGGGLLGRAGGEWFADQLYPPEQTAFEGAYSTE
jgi:hypothetical protein